MLNTCLQSFLAMHSSLRKTNTKEIGEWICDFEVKISIKMSKCGKCPKTNNNKLRPFQASEYPR